MNLHHFFITLFLTIFVYINVSHADQYKRIAVSGGSITEIIYRLGEEKRIVGLDSTSQFPAEAKAHPTIGYVRNVSVEGVLSLEPDLLIGEIDTGPPKMLKQIKATGVDTVIIENDDTVPAISEKITRIASLLGTEGKGKQLIKEIQVDLDALAFAVDKISTSPRVLFLLSLSNGAPIASGHTTSAHTAIIEAGGINVLGQYKGWKKLSPESALALKPDVIVVMNRGKNVFEQIKKLPHFTYTPAVTNKAVYTIDGGYLLGFGPRTPQAIVELATMIHPNLLLPKGYQFRYSRKQFQDQPVGH